MHWQLQTILVTTSKKNGQSKTNVSICPALGDDYQKTEENVAEDCNRPLGLILEWKIMMMMTIICMH
jgi:hypothetical protein